MLAGVTVYLDFDQANTFAAFYKEIDFVTGIAYGDLSTSQFSDPQKILLRTKIETELERIYNDLNVDFTTDPAEKAGADEVINFSAVPNNVASATVSPEGDDNDLTFTAMAASAFSDYTIEYIDDELFTNSVTLDLENRKLTFEITDGTTTASDVKDMLAADPVAKLYFSAEFFAADDGTGLVKKGASAITESINATTLGSSGRIDL